MEQKNKKPSTKIAYMAISVNIMVLLQNIHILDEVNHPKFLLEVWILFSSCYSIYNIGTVIKWFREEAKNP